MKAARSGHLQTAQFLVNKGMMEKMMSLYASLALHYSLLFPSPYLPHSLCSPHCVSLPVPPSLYLPHCTCTSLTVPVPPSLPHCVSLTVSPSLYLYLPPSLCLPHCTSLTVSPSLYLPPSISLPHHRGRCQSTHSQ